MEYPYRGDVKLPDSAESVDGCAAGAVLAVATPDGGEAAADVPEAPHPDSTAAVKTTAKPPRPFSGRTVRNPTTLLTLMPCPAAAYLGADD